MKNLFTSFVVIFLSGSYGPYAPKNLTTAYSPMHPFSLKYFISKRVDPSSHAILVIEGDCISKNPLSLKNWCIAPNTVDLTLKILVSFWLLIQRCLLSSKSSGLWSFFIGKTSANPTTLKPVACTSKPPGALSSFFTLPVISTEDSIRAFWASSSSQLAISSALCCPAAVASRSMRNRFDSSCKRLASPLRA